MSTFQPLPTSSLSGEQVNIALLKKVLPACVVEVKDSTTGEVREAVNFQVLRSMLGDAITENHLGGASLPEERYEFTWPGKREALREAQTPITDTLRPVVEDSVNWDTTENLYIEGDNLRVLKLLQKTYMNKVKMIYIDPPYNTGKEFVYNDNFHLSEEDYSQVSGALDEEGRRLFELNSKTQPRYHSDWCSMMYARLLLARNLLTEDGVIFISIDDNEVHNLRKICDEVFGAGNFVAELIWERAFAPKNDAKYISNSHDYILIIAKSIENYKIGRLPRTEEANARYTNPDNDPRGPWQSSDISVKTYNAANDYPITTPSGRVIEPPAGRCWRLSSKAFEERLRQDRIWFGPDGNGVPRIKRFLSELKFDGMAPTSLLFYKEVGHSQEGAQEVNKLMEGGFFDGPKPIRLLRRLLTLANLQSDSLILDFFSGSATTAHAVMQLNAEDGGKRKFIMVQLPEETATDSEAYKAGYHNICEIGKERIRRAGRKIKEELVNKAELGTEAPRLDTGFRVLRLDSSNKTVVEFDPYDVQQEDAWLFAPHIKDDRSELDLLFGALLQWGVALSVPMTAQQVGRATLHLVNRNEATSETDVVVCLGIHAVTTQVVEAIAQLRPRRVLFRDESFADDQMKLNTYELLKQHLGWTAEETTYNIRVI